jgi:hypothetical protein
MFLVCLEMWDRVVSPLTGLAIWGQAPIACAMGYFLTPFGLGRSTRLTPWATFYRPGGLPERPRLCGEVARLGHKFLDRKCCFVFNRVRVLVGGCTRCSMLL